MEDKSSITALMSAFIRAYHTESEENPVFSDSIARKLFTDEEYNQMKKYIISGAEFFIPKLKGKKHDFSEEALLDVIVNTSLAPTPIARARYCEDCLKISVLSGTEQYVILGAGYDTFAWREKELMKKLNVFEIDHPLTQADKKRRIARANLQNPSNLHFVPVDFTKDSLKEKLLASGFDITKKTFFSWLGVSYYLTDEQVRKMFSEISSFSAEGSTIVFDYADKGLFGYAVSVRDISGQIGITQSALYKHYKNKQDIMNNIINRMEENDLKQAQKYDMPETNEDNRATPENLKAFTIEMFRYWTEDPFALSFRKMLTLEQYRDSEMSNLYNQYILSKPLEYVQGIMKELTDADPKQKALEFYSPVFMLMNMYDSADDKQEITELLKKYINEFEF